jgi:hypothetical protein
MFRSRGTIKMRMPAINATMGPILIKLIIPISPGLAARHW